MKSILPSLLVAGLAACSGSSTDAGALLPPPPAPVAPAAEPAEIGGLWIGSWVEITRPGEPTGEAMLFVEQDGEHIAAGAWLAGAFAPTCGSVIENSFEATGQAYVTETLTFQGTHDPETGDLQGEWFLGEDRHGFWTVTLEQPIRTRLSPSGLTNCGH